MKGKDIGIAKCVTHTQEIIKKYTSIREAALEHGISAVNLKDVLSRPRPVAYGFWWEKIGRVKRCKQCGEVKQRAEFRSKGIKSKQYSPICMECEVKNDIN